MKDRNEQKGFFATRRFFIMLIGLNFAANSIIQIIRHFTRPETAQPQSAPWYMGIIISAAIYAAGIVLWRVIIAILDKLGK